MISKIAWLLGLALAVGDRGADAGLAEVPSQGASSPNDRPHKFRGIHVGDTQGVIVPSDKSNGIAWTPDEKNIRSFERGLPEFLKAARMPAAPYLERHLSEYKRQYIGKMQRGSRLLFVVFACKVRPDWQDVVSITKDGGECFFEVEYDASLGTYRNLSVHGRA